MNLKIKIIKLKIQTFPNFLQYLIKFFIFAIN